MEMCDDEVGVVDLEIDRDGGEHHASQTTDHKNEDKAANKKERNRKGAAACSPPSTFRLFFFLGGKKAAAPDGCEPAKNLNPTRDRDHHARPGEEAATEEGQRGGKHVVHPKPETDESRRDERKNERGVTKDWTTRKCFDDG